MKYFTLLSAVAVTVSTAFGQVSTAPQTAPNSDQSLVFQHGPMRRAGVGKLKNGAEESYNWGGYGVTGTNFTNATGSWIVPTMDCAKSPNSAVAIWVGIDGLNSSSVEQTGVGVVCEHATAVYYAWYEFYPNPSYTISTITVHPGDVFSASVSYSSGSGEFSTTITDVTTGATATNSAAISGAARSSAEWIVEAPESSATGILNLTDFGKAYMGDDATHQSGTNAATDSTNSGVIKTFGTAVDAITQIDWLGYKEQTPSALSSDGSTFYDTWIEFN
jgi:Peptidase A4 family